MQLTGKIEVFQNQNGYHTAVIKAWDESNTKVLGKAFVDAKLPEGIKCEKGQTLTLNVKEGYLSAVFVPAQQNTFTKLKINIKEAEVLSVFPEPEAKKAKKSAKTSKGGK